MNREQLSMVWTLPNVLTMGRILLAPVFFVLLMYSRSTGQVVGMADEAIAYQIGAIVTFCVILLTDFLDGYIARKRNLCTVFGAVLDPVADKILVISTFILLAVYGVIPPWLAVIVVSKDIVLSLGWLLLHVLHYDSSVKPSRSGRATLVLQSLVILAALVGMPKNVNLFLWAFTGGLTLLSTLGYIKDGLLRSTQQPAKAIEGNSE